MLDVTGRIGARQLNIDTMELLRKSSYILAKRSSGWRLRFCGMSFSWSSCVACYDHYVPVPDLPMDGRTGGGKCCLWFRRLHVVYRCMTSNRHSLSSLNIGADGMHHPNVGH